MLPRSRGAVRRPRKGTRASGPGRSGGQPMRRHPGVSLVMAALACLFLTACGTDTGVTLKVKAKLAADSTVNASQIDVQTHDGVVTLTGNVSSPAEKDQAIALARSTSGVRDVVDRIAAERSNGTGDAPDMDRTVGEVIDDASVTRHVKGRLLEDETVRGLSIDVDTREGIV